MSRVLWLPDVLRSADLIVHEVDGWRTRGESSDGARQYAPRGVIVHATAGSRNSTDAGEIRVLLNGSNTAPAPISQLYLGRSGEWWVVASGKCNHALTGTKGALRGLGNWNLLGIEAANNNVDEVWPEAQFESYIRGVAALTKFSGWTAAGNVSGHKEHQYGKSDPTFDMNHFRLRVAQQVMEGIPANAVPAWPGRTFVYEPSWRLMSGNDISRWQQQMRARGWVITVDGIYGPASELVCQKFQRDSTNHGWSLDVDGEVGPKTWDATWRRPVS